MPGVALSRSGGFPPVPLATASAAGTEGVRGAASAVLSLALLAVREP